MQPSRESESVFQRADEDVNFKGSQFSAEALWRRGAPGDGVYCSFLKDLDHHLVYMSKTNQSPDVAATSEQTDQLISDWRGVRVPGIAQSLQESTAGSGKRNSAVNSSVSNDIRSHWLGSEAHLVRRTLRLPLGSPLIRPVARSDKRGTGPTGAGEAEVTRRRTPHSVHLLPPRTTRCPAVSLDGRWGGGGFSPLISYLSR